MALEAAATVAREAGIAPHILGNAIEGEARDLGLDGRAGVSAIAGDTDGVDGRSRMIKAGRSPRPAGAPGPPRSLP